MGRILRAGSDRGDASCFHPWSLEYLCLKFEDYTMLRLQTKYRIRRYPYKDSIERLTITIYNRLYSGSYYHVLANIGVMTHCDMARYTESDFRINT